MTTASSLPNIKLPAGRTMLDVVLYVATLVSKPSDVDPQLDRVRVITAQRSVGQFTEEDKRILDEVYGYLEEYLVTKEELRSFTRESVREKIQAYLGGKRRSNLVRPLSVIGVIATVGALAAIVTPLPLVSDTFRPSLAITAIFMTIYIGSAWLFWTGLENFQDKIRQAYLPICIGIIITAAGLLQLPVIELMGLQTSILFTYVTSAAAAPISQLLIYLGIRRFAWIGGSTSKLLSGKLIFILCVVTPAVITLIPKPVTSVPSWALIASTFILTIGAVLTLSSATIALSVRKSLGVAYKRPMAWFTAFMLSSGLTCVLYLSLELIATQAHPYKTEGYALLPLLLTAFTILKAATSFREIGTKAQ